jgi:hypothetical protein
MKVNLFSVICIIQVSIHGGNANRILRYTKGGNHINQGHNMTAMQIPGHLYGPPPVHIAFLCGDNYLGEARGHPTDVASAFATVKRHLEFFNGGYIFNEDYGKLARLHSPLTRAVIYCGGFAMDVRDYFARERRIEAEQQLALDRVVRADFMKSSSY